MTTGQAAGGAVPPVQTGSVKPPKRSLGSDWGTVTVSGRQVPIRALVAVAGIVVWLGLMFLEAGGGSIEPLQVSVLFLVPLVAIGSLTRSVGLALIGRLVLIGGFGLSIAWVVISLFTTLVPDLNAPIRDFVVPPIEEATKFAPLLVILWFRRRGTGWSFGATDLLLMGAAVGVGFGLVESAYTTGQGSAPDSVTFLPITEIYHGSGRNAVAGWGHLVVGHALWAAIGGGMLGIALQLQGRLRGRGRAAFVVAVFGVAWTTLDHIANNYSSVHPGDLANQLIFVTADGWVALGLFVAVVVLAVAIDLRTLWTALPDMAVLAPPALTTDPALFAASWGFRLRRRSLAYTVAHGRGAAEVDHPAFTRTAAGLAQGLLYRRYELEGPRSSPPGPIARTA